VAFRAPIDSVLNLWVAPIDRVDEARPVTAVTDRNLGPWIVWMRDNRHVVFFREAAGDENWRAWRVDLETGDVRPLTPGPVVTCRIQQISRHFPSELLIMHNAREKRYFDIYRVNVATGESTLVQLNEGFAFHFTDQQFRVRFAVRHTPTTAMSSICSAARTVNGPSSAGSAPRTRWRPARSSSASTVVISIGWTAGAATPPPWSRKTSKMARCGFSRKTPAAIS